MSITYTSDKPLLTVGQVQQWQARKEELNHAIEAAQVELMEINANLEAALRFMPKANGQTEPVQAAAPPNLTEDRAAAGTVTDAIVAAATKFGANGAFPADLKKELVASGFDMSKFEHNTGYFYTVLGRLVTRERLERRRNGMYRVRAASPKGETGAVAAPASH